MAESRIIAFSNQKGGVGKTTSAVNIAASLAAAEYRVLLVDFDPQGNASSALGIEAREKKPSSYEML
ncbi:MAG: chromosome partitioning protein, partial [Pseudomonadota bacterium]